MSFLSNGNNFNNTCCNNKLARHICHFIGKPVTILQPVAEYQKVVLME